MSKMSELFTEIHNMYEEGVEVGDISTRLNLSVDFVSSAFDDDESIDESIDESMDGDFDSAMESCGWGYDEQYNGWSSDEY